MEQMSLISKKKGKNRQVSRRESGRSFRSYIQKLLKDGLILVNGKKVKANYKLNEGDQIDVEVPDRNRWILQQKIFRWIFCMKMKIF